MYYSCNLDQIKIETDMGGRLHEAMEEANLPDTLHLAGSKQVGVQHSLRLLE